MNDLQAHPGFCPLRELDRIRWALTHPDQLGSAWLSDPEDISGMLSWMLYDKLSASCSSNSTRR